jgi:hypothetical protein
MPRIRTLKPEIWGSQSFNRLSRDARLVFIGLITQADDEGFFRADVRTLAGAILPVDRQRQSIVARALSDLASDLDPMIELWRHDRGTFGRILGWSRHQVVKNPGKTRFPRPDDPGSSRLFPPPGSGIEDQGSGIKDPLLSPAPPQVMLPGMPPTPPKQARAPSPQEEIYAALREHRLFFMEHELGVEPEPDEEMKPAGINTALKPLLEHVAPFVTPERTAKDLVLAIFNGFLKDQWASTLDPAFALRAFFSQKVWPKHSPFTAAERELDS